MRKTQLFIALAAVGFAGSAFATNGMNLEGYGPIATGMGGASMAYDNGNAAMMNNPATLGLAGDGSRLDVALGFLGPNVKNVTSGEKSGGDAYFMPAIGWTKKSGNLTYGVGMFGQGGMGTEYNLSLDMLQTGEGERSELGVGRLMAPIAYNVNDKLTIAGSLDFVWAMLDLKMAMPIANMAGLITPTGAGNGTLTGALNALALGGYDNARLDFSDGNDYTGKARGYGFAGKLGFAYKLSPMVSIGGTYHTKTNLGDLETGTTGASMIVTDTGGNPTQTVPGKISVRDFQWPETYGIGVSIQATPSLLVAADYKRINWKDVMKNFTMTYSALGDSITFALPQNWDDQNVFQIGLSYKATGSLTLRAGVSLSDNPIPDATMHYLFPAIEKNHYTAGLGYAFDASSDLNFSLQFAPKVTQTNSTFGYTVSHSQTSWQLMYSKRF
ncbi:MAG TPA: outer membrane protein transport protein [Thiobacillaceae bacterium]|nr:outer membrane protein transport protein [Thiobacillaceae bacterium]HNG03280.1 outer membrane protein transport protein [Nitrospira sp.]HNI07914.1 outer membrane protein transport protein [Thiobacillaceae bacterium]